MKYNGWVKSKPDDVTPPENEHWLAKFYRWFWSRIGGRPWTFILRDSWHNRSFLWFCLLLAISGFIGSSWKAIIIFISTHFFWY